MNVDAKIASKAIATWMKNVISSIIKTDHTPYVTGRYIGESIHLISDILEHHLSVAVITFTVHYSLFPLLLF